MVGSAGERDKRACLKPGLLGLLKREADLVKAEDVAKALVDDEVSVCIPFNSAQRIPDAHYSQTTLFLFAHRPCHWLQERRSVGVARSKGGGKKKKK